MVDPRWLDSPQRSFISFNRAGGVLNGFRTDSGVRSQGFCNLRVKGFRFMRDTT